MHTSSATSVSSTTRHEDTYDFDPALFEMDEEQQQGMLSEYGDDVEGEESMLVSEPCFVVPTRNN